MAGPPTTPRIPESVGNALHNADRAMGEALHVAEPYVDLARALPLSPRPSDAYEARRSPTDQLADMRRFIIFRPGRAHEVAAMGDRTEPGARPASDDVMRVIRDGRMIAVPSRGTEEAARAGTAHPAQAAQNAAQLREMLSSLTKEELSVFERIFMAHFEGGIPVGEKLAAGQFKFLSKSEKAWVEFFQKFLPFTLEKKVKTGDVEMLVFRGLFEDMHKEQAAKGEKAPVLFLVSDMKFLDGKTDKFARLQIAGQDLLKTMSEQQPGNVLGKEMLAQIAEKLGGEEFSYLSLSHRIVNPDMVDKTKNPIAEAYRTPEQMKGQAIREGTRDVSQGIALSARTEQLIAEKLDINLKAQARGDLGAVERRGGEAQGMPGVDLGGLFLGKKKRKGMGTDYDEAGGQSPYVPWWLAPMQPKKFKGKARWWVPFLYFLGASAVGLALVYAFRYWISR
ncbi:MAG TPA: hypothetical protein VLJ37_08670 [bacterium]|nr:hypothetical protein [bacterium]